MPDVPTFLANIAGELDNQNLRNTAFLQQALVRSLQKASTVRTLFMEGSFTFMTTPGQGEYATGRLPGTTPYVGPTPTYTPPAGTVIGVPADLQEIDSFYCQLSTTLGMPGIPLKRVTVAQLRAAFYPLGSFQGLYASMYAFHHESIIVGPIPGGNTQLGGDYLRDATRDQTTGAVITGTDAPGTTNPWLNDGQYALRALVLRDYHRGLSKDDQQADYMDTEWKEAVAFLATQERQAKAASIQAPRSFGEDRGEWWFN